MKIYFAHNYAAREWLKNNMSYLLPLGGECVSRWIMKGTGSAEGDLEDINKADIVVFFAAQHGVLPGRGKFVELGYAIAKRKLIVVVRAHVALEESCVFLELPPTQIHLTLSEYDPCKIAKLWDMHNSGNRRDFA